MRVPRWTIVLSAGAVAVGAASLVASLVLVRNELGATPRPPASPTPTRPAAELQRERVLDPSLDLSERLLELKALASEAPSAAPLVNVLRRLKGASPDELQLRASTLTALGRFPEDGAAREYLVVLAFSRGAARSERTLALDLLARRPDLAQCEKALGALRQDPEPQIRARAEELLVQIRATATPTPSPR